MFLSYNPIESKIDCAQPPLELRELVINKTFAFQSFPRSIGHLKHLKRLFLDSLLSGSRLLSLPEEFCRLHSLEHLVLRCCDKLSSLPSRFGYLVNLRHIDLKCCRSLEVLPMSFRLLINLEYLNLSGCYELALESNILENMTRLKVFDVSLCKKLQVLPHDVTNLASLGELHLRNTSSLRVLPASIGQLSKLKWLIIVECQFLTKLPISLGNLSSLVILQLESCPELYEMPSLAGLVSLSCLDVKDCDKIKKIEGLEHLTSLEKLLVWTCWMVPGIHSLSGTEGLWMLDLKAENISAFEACIQSIQIGVIENWPWRMKICARIFPHVQSILDSFSFPGLAGHNSLKMSYYSNAYRYSLTCRETNMTEAAIVYFLVRSIRGGSVDLYEGQDSPAAMYLDTVYDPNASVVLSEGEWIIISVLSEVHPIIKEEGRFLQASIDVYPNIMNYLADDFFEEEDKVYGGRLIIWWKVNSWRERQHCSRF